MPVELNQTIRGGDANLILHKGAETIYFFVDWDGKGNTLVVQDNYYEPVAVTLMDDSERREHYEAWINESYTTMLKGE